MWNNDQGEFVRYTSKFRQWIRSDSSTPFSPDDSRYHLYVSLACPWAHRTLIVRSLLGLEDAITVSIVDPVWNDSGWTFTSNEGCIPDFVNGKQDLVDIYRLANPHYNEEETTPVLWDKSQKTIVNNESLEIIKMFASEFHKFKKSKLDLYPLSLRKEIDQVIADIYHPINNGVYRAGFATSQAAYERAYSQLFSALNHWEHKLSTQRYMCGSQITLADVCFFTTLIRFDFVYYSHFKCNSKHIYEYPHLWGFVRDMYQTPGVAPTCNIQHIKRHYYISQKFVNPSQVVPCGPNLDLLSPHGRDAL